WRGRRSPGSLTQDQGDGETHSRRRGGDVDEQAVIEGTRRWISSFVIGLSLCPFARRVFDAGAIRYLVSDAEDEETLLGDLAGELAALASSPISTVETTLLIHPRPCATSSTITTSSASGTGWSGPSACVGSFKSQVFIPTTGSRAPPRARWRITRTGLPTRCCTCCARSAFRRSRAGGSESPGATAGDRRTPSGDRLC